MTDFIIIKADGTKEAGVADWPHHPGYDRIKTLIRPLLDDNQFEHVSVLHEGKRTDMFVDEMGMMNGLWVNTKATEIYRNNTMTHQPDTNPDDLPQIYGTAILFATRVWF